MHQTSSSDIGLLKVARLLTAIRCIGYIRSPSVCFKNNVHSLHLLQHVRGLHVLHGRLAAWSTRDQHIEMHKLRSKMPRSMRSDQHRIFSHGLALALALHEWWSLLWL